MTKKAWKSLSTEAVNPRSARLDRLGIEKIVALMQIEDRRVLEALRNARPAIVRSANLFQETYLSGGICFLFGAGTSGRLAVLEAAELPPTFGTDPRRARAVMAGGRGAVFRAKEGAEDRGDEGERAAARARKGDLAIGVSASSVTPFVRGALERARRAGAKTVLVTASRARGMRTLADVVVRLDVGPEVVAGSTRLKAGTATKLALNQITTSALASAGKVYGPWMIDLRAGSAKLRDRALRIVAAACGVSTEEARRLLARARGEIRTAIVMGRTGGRYAEARRRLDRASGDLRRALVSKDAAPRSRRTSRRG
ncbi:MAG TPA: N-acetylmuramic acid 6-phosphate etherase [Thermoanaerobaculia bacterium]|jgi:N-acetylmuramic acid 6-phosphate etherase|nr:N-acetylmuramic acid 6-phosphate etherase [Thermoanaerobaculia bacterium]